VRAAPAVRGALEEPAAAREPRARGYWSSSLARLRDHRVGFTCGVVLLLMGVVAALAPALSQYVTHYGPYDQNLDQVFAPVSRQHLLGTDELGRDTLTRLIYGGQVSLGVGLLTVSISMLVGGGVGLVAAHYGGVVDELLMRLVDMLLAIPTIYLLILLTSLLPLRVGPVVLQHNAVSLSVLLAATSWGGVARLIRGSALAVEHQDFMLATRSLGAGGRRLILRHLVPNVLPTAVVVASLGVATVILVEAALDFIGLGIQPPSPSWGNMLIKAQIYFYHSQLLVIVPGLTVLATVMMVNLFANAVRDAFDPRLA
jgi:peptide/nickel transport system permease protein